jgi:hypothetical protein
MMQKIIQKIDDTMSWLLGNTCNETKFLNKFMGKVENTFKGSEINDPIKAAMSLMGSGILTDMSKEIQSGKLNIGKLIGNRAKNFLVYRGHFRFHKDRSYRPPL